MRGECSLNDAVYACLASGAPATPYILQRYEAAIRAYLKGEVADLAEPFGIAMTKRAKNAVKRLSWVSHVRFHVDAAHKQGFKLQDPSKYENTAFHTAARLLHRSPTHVFDTYYAK